MIAALASLIGAILVSLVGVYLVLFLGGPPWAAWGIGWLSFLIVS